jgi:L-serine dehydratase
MDKEVPDFISVFNDVLGPVMRGPSSSHTAGSYRIALISKSLLNEFPMEASFTFGKNRSYVQVYKEQGVDSAFAAGLMGWDITDPRFFQSIESAQKRGLNIVFNKGELKDKHPNAVQIQLSSKYDKKIEINAKSIGGGAVKITGLNGWSVDIDGKSHVLIIEYFKQEQLNILDFFNSDSDIKIERKNKHNKTLICFKKSSKFDEEILLSLRQNPKVKNIWISSPVFFTRKGKELFLSSEEIITKAKRTKKTLGQVAIEYESKLLGLSPQMILKEMQKRFQVMEDSVQKGFINKNVNMRLLRPCAGKIIKSEAKGQLLGGGIHLRAAARAMAVMHIANSGGIVCAAPTGGSAGVLPGVAVTLQKDLNINRDILGRSLFAAGAVGLIIARRATFAAEEAGCQAEIGAAGAMAAAAVVESAGGSAQQALNAAGISLQNTMGSVCDLVQGMCEIPCHTRNAAAASNAFLCADLILGGYKNLISFDETVDALYSVGKMMPSELKCTAKGGIALAPSAKSISKIR